MISLFLLVIVTKNEIIQRLDRRHRIHLNVVLNLKRKNDKILKLYGRTQSTLKILYDNSWEEIYFIVRNKNISFTGNNQIIEV